MKAETSTYEQTALEILAAMGVTLSAKFLRHGKHFDGDAAERDIYTCTLTRGRRTISVAFGRSLAHSAAGNFPDFMKYRWNGPKGTLFDEGLAQAAFEKSGAALWFVCGEMVSSAKYNNCGSNNRVAPTAYDVLASLTKSNPGTFEDFCGETGYDTDSRSAEKTYRAVVDEWLKVSAFFTAEEIEKLQKIQ